MKPFIYILFWVVGICMPLSTMAQVDFNKTPDDDLGNVEDEFQQYFFEAIKQKGIENYDRAIEALKKCLNLRSTEPAVYYELGKNYNTLKNFGAAEEALKKAVSMDEDNEWYLDELYDVYIQQDDFKRAIKTVEQLVKYHPDYKEDLAALYIKAEKYSDALKILDQLDDKYGISQNRDLLRNEIYNLTGDDSQRITHLESRIRNNPENEDNYLKLVYRYSEMGQTNKAQQVAERLLKVNPNSQLVHLALYKFYLNDNKIDEAIHSMKIVLTSSSVNADAKTKVLNDFVAFVRENPQYENQLLEVTSLIDDNKSKKTLLELAQYYLKTGDKSQALNYYEQALNEDPNNFNIIKNVLMLKLDNNKNESAIKQSNKALELFPAQPIFYLINGVAYNNLNKPKQAIEQLEMGLIYLIDNPKMEADFYTQLSKAYKLNNNTDKSEIFAKKAAQLLEQQQ